MAEPPASTPGPLPAGRRRSELIAHVKGQLASLARGETVVVAHSGGPDSTALLFLAAEARPDLQYVPVHVRHGLRDDRADVAAVRRAASWLGLLPVIRSVDVVGDGGPEAAARTARWHVVRTVARDLAAAAVLVGHTADDQAETVLLNAARGAGLRGVGGMAPWREDQSGSRVGRPLLLLRRADVRAFVIGDGLPFVDDPTNQDPAIRRNRVRAVVLPALDEVAGDAVAALARLADLARLDDDTLDRLTSDVLTTRAIRWGPGWSLDAEVLDQLPGVARRAVQQLLDGAGASTVDALLVSSVLALESGQERHASGLKASRDQHRLAVVPAGIAPPGPVELPRPGQLAWGPGLVLHVTWTVVPPGGLDGADGEGTAEGGQAPQATLDLGDVDPPELPDAPLAPPPGGRPERATVLLPVDVPTLTVRPRRSGDRIATAAGTRKVAAVMADAGVPRVLRDHVPVVELGGRVVWIAGVDGDAELLRRGRRGPSLRVSICTSGPGSGTGAGQ